MAYENRFVPRIGHQLVDHKGEGIGAVAYVSPNQNPRQYERGFDAAATIELLKAAIVALEGGDGVEAVQACGAAWFRISTFHHSGARR